MNFEKDVYITLGKNIRKFRLEKGLSQERLSEMLNVNSKFIGHVERVERFISLQKLILLSKLLEVPIQQFFMLE